MNTCLQKWISQGSSESNFIKMHESFKLITLKKNIFIHDLVTQGNSFTPTTMFQISFAPPPHPGTFHLPLHHILLCFIAPPPHPGTFHLALLHPVRFHLPLPHCYVSFAPPPHPVTLLSETDQHLHVPNSMFVFGMLGFHRPIKF